MLVFHVQLGCFLLAPSSLRCCGDDQPVHRPPVHVPRHTVAIGSTDAEARADESPVHPVEVGPFWMDPTEVTNQAFAAFVEATGYTTTAEQPVDWDELKAQLPPGTPKPSDELLLPGSMVFALPPNGTPAATFTDWWRWVPGACWRHPEGPESSIENRMNHPVVHVSWYDATAYAKWAAKDSPPKTNGKRPLEVASPVPGTCGATMQLHRNMPTYGKARSQRSTPKPTGIPGQLPWDSSPQRLRTL